MGVPITVDSEDVDRVLALLGAAWIDPAARYVVDREAVGALLRIAGSVDRVLPVEGVSRTEGFEGALAASRPRALG